MISSGQFPFIWNIFHLIGAYYYFNWNVGQGEAFCAQAGLSHTSVLVEVHLSQRAKNKPSAFRNQLFVLPVQFNKQVQEIKQVRIKYLFYS